MLCLLQTLVWVGCECVVSFQRPIERSIKRTQQQMLRCYGAACGRRSSSFIRPFVRCCCRRRSSFVCCCFRSAFVRSFVVAFVLRSFRCSHSCLPFLRRCVRFVALLYVHRNTTAIRNPQCSSNLSKVGPVHQTKSKSKVKVQKSKSKSKSKVKVLTKVKVGVKVKSPKVKGQSHSRSRCQSQSIHRSSSIDPINRTTVNNEQQTANNKQRTTNREQQTTNSEQQTVN